MCGIALGIYEDDNYKFDMLDVLSSIKHRGPDASSVYKYNFGKISIDMGHVRLSVIDTGEHANQPFFSSCGNYVLIFNGEIYNYIEIKAELMALGVEFHTNSDTEVLLRAYMYWKEEVFHKLEGMYAFIILNKVNSCLIIARDPLGIKPLYYHHDQENNQLFIASEIKAIQKMGIIPMVDSTQICEFLLNNWLYEPNTGFSNIFKVLPGAVMNYDLLTGLMVTETFFHLGQFPKESSSISEDITKEVSQQLRADVRLGLFFSGGNDSSLIAALARQKKNELMCIFSKYSPHDIQSACLFDDHPFAEQIAKILNMKMNTYEFSFDKYGKKLDEIAKHVAIGNEELNGDYTYLASCMISESARKDGYVVMLSGMGADEVFAGYPRYLLLRYLKLARYINNFMGFLIKPILKTKRSFEKKYDRLESFIKDSDKNFALAYSNLLGYFSLSDMNQNFIDKIAVASVVKSYQILNEKIKNLSPLKKGMYLDSLGYLAHNFIVADKSSMANSIELRVPLVSERLFQKTFQMHDRQLISAFKTKIPLKTMLSRFLKRSHINRKKTGFNPPLERALEGFGRQNTLNLLKTRLSEYLKADYLDSLVGEHFGGIKNNTYKLLQLVYLSAWLSIYEVK
jgi:asparagine synthase (glutamine-hydrolysing)